MNCYTIERGHGVYWNWECDDADARYTDTDEIVDPEHPRPCTRCGKLPDECGHDACLSDLPGVVAACCGHGVEDPYMLTASGYEIRADGMYTWMRRPLCLEAASPTHFYSSSNLMFVRKHIIILEPPSAENNQRYVCTLGFPIVRSIPMKLIGNDLISVENPRTIRWEKSIPQKDVELYQTKFWTALKDQIINDPIMLKDAEHMILSMHAPNILEADKMRRAYEYTGIDPSIIDDFWSTDTYVKGLQWVCNGYHIGYALTTDDCDLRIIFEARTQELLYKFDELLDQFSVFAEEQNPHEPAN